MSMDIILTQSKNSEDGKNKIELLLVNLSQF